MVLVTTANQTAVAVREVTKIYGQAETAVRALNQVSVSFASGQFTAIMGPSGSGKSTLMHCAAGLDQVTSGTIVLAGKEITQLSDRALTMLRRTHVGFIFQAFNLLPTLTARQNILLPLELAGTRPDLDWFQQVVGALGLAERLNHTPSQLSGGQQQRVACARALLPRPKVIFADEPTGNLDSRAGAEVLSFLRRAVDEFGQTIVMVTHDPVAAAYSDQVVMLADGQIVGEISQPTQTTVLNALRRLGA
jgi:putative ABC transport system ATP-binding protein